MLSIEEQFQSLLDNVKGQVSDFFPIEGRKRILRAKNIRMDKADPGRMLAWNQIQKAKDNEGSFLSMVRGDLELVDKNTGKVVENKKNQVLAHVPHMTGLNSFVVNGKDLQVINQLRRRPGIYPSYTSDDNVQSRITSTGANYDVILNRKTGEYLMKVGTSNLKLVPFLKDLGVPEKKIIRAIGKDAYDQNINVSSNRDELKRFWDKVRSKPAPEDRKELIKEVNNFLESKPLDADVTQTTIDTPHKNISANAIVDATRAVREVANGKRLPADMESLVFKSIHSVEDFVGDRLKKSIPGIKARMKFQVDEKSKIKDMFGPMLLSKPILSEFTMSEFTRYSDQNNPLDVLGTSQGVTVMGEGGISTVHQVPEDVRNIHPTHLGFIDPLHTAEDIKIGLSNHLTEGVLKRGNQMYRRVWDAKKKKMTVKSPVELSRSVVAFPDQFKPDDPKRPKAFKPINKTVMAINKGTFDKVSSRKVDYVLPTTQSPFSFVTNAVPFMHSNSGARMLMAGRHLEQAVSLTDREAPLVQSEYHGVPYDKAIGNAMLTAADKPGVVTKVKPGVISIRHEGERKSTKYEIPDHYPLNSETYMTETPLVKVGDKVKKGQRLTESNFSKNGDLALGKNLTTAFIPWKGHNFEDGIVISENAAQKLTSEHKHEMRVEKDRNVKIGKKYLFAQFPDMKEHWDSDRKDDLPKPGDTIKPGQIIIPAIQEQKLGPQTEYSRIHKALHKPYKDASVRWRELTDGKVVRVVKNPNFVKVFVKTKEPMQVGDKLSSRAGSKGIVTKIVPDNEMPRNEEGEVVDVLFNPYGLPGRMNPGLMFEASMGKVSKKTGKPTVVQNFNNVDSQVKWVKSQLKKHGLKDTETIDDPTHNRQHKNILSGPVHWLKLKHQVRNKLSARGHADGYTIDGRPAKGGVDEEDISTSAQSIGPLELYSLMAGGHTEFLKDASGIKSNQNVDFWNAYQTGQPTPEPVVPTVLDRFHSYLEGAGIRLTNRDDTLQATPFTDKEILKRSKGRITEPGVVRTSGFDLVEEKNGLFDKKITGGLQGGPDKWSHIELAERILHPLYEKPVQAVTGLKKKELDGLLSGKKFVDKDGNLVSSDATNNLTGGEGVHRLLSKIDVQKELRSSRARLATANKTEKPKLLKKIKYLSSLDRMKLNPAEAFTNKYLPVVPPTARPIYAMDDGNLNVADPNHGYREVLFINRALEDLKKHKIGNETLAPVRAGLYKATAGLVGLTTPLTRNANFKGFISTIAGQQNKTGLFQSKVVKRTQDLSGRSTLIVDPKLHMDHIGIPKPMAKKVFAPMAIRKMVVSYGLNPVDARDELQKLTPRAEKALQDTMAERPVILNRAPSLHKFSTVSAIGKLVDGQAIQINPLTVGGLNADFDGDTAALHIPVSEKARIESWKKLPSKTLISPKDLKVIHAPSKEALFGLYYMTKPVKGKATPVKDAQDVLKQLKERKIDVNSPIKYKGKTWTPGHFMINSVLPDKYKINHEPFTGGKIKSVINDMARSHPKQVGDVITKLKDFGFDHASKLGFSVGLDDLDNPQIDKLNKSILPKIMQRAKKKDPVEAIIWGSDKAEKAMDKLKDNRFAELTYLSGAGGKYKGNVQQMVMAPIGVKDTKGAAVPIPITRGYARGMDMGSYWATLPGMRKGLADRAISTADTGAFAKELNNTTIGLRIGGEDCKTTNGIELPVNHSDLAGRFIADGSFKGKLASPDILKQMRGKGVKTVKVRSPATCALKTGVCAKCMGTNESGSLYNKGFHIGALVGTTISEPLTQMVMRTFHTGAKIGGGEVGYRRINQIFNMPKNIRGKAPLSTQAGKVEDILETDRGGWEVTVGGAKHFVPTELKLRVKKGQKIKAGDQLSQHGVVHPRELANYKGIDKARDLLLTDIEKEMKASGQNVRRRIYEAAVRPLIDKALVTNPGDAEAKYHVQPGDVVSSNHIPEMNKGLKRPLQAEPHLMSIKEVPFTREDFIGPLMFQRIPRTLTRAPAYGTKTKLKGMDSHPVVEYVYNKMAGEEPKYPVIIWDDDVAE